MGAERASLWRMGTVGRLLVWTIGFFAGGRAGCCVQSNRRERMAEAPDLAGGGLPRRDCDTPAFAHRYDRSRRLSFDPLSSRKRDHPSTRATSCPGEDRRELAAASSDHPLNGQTSAMFVTRETATASSDRV